MVGPSNTLGSPWLPLAIHPCDIESCHVTSCIVGVESGAAALLIVTVFMLKGYVSIFWHVNLFFYNTIVN